MTHDQRTVAIGAVTGVAAMLLLVWGLSSSLPPPAIADAAGDRIAYALRWAVIAVLPLFAMIVAIGNARFLSEAIDPTLGKENRAMIIDGRVADNTLQQFAVFLVGLLALSVNLPLHRLSIIAALSTVFVIARTAFWIGYRIRPAYRAAGFAATASMNFGMLAASLLLWMR
jgi:hypothetical protein